MDQLKGQSQRHSLTSNSFLTYRSSGVIAHRLSVYMPSIFPPSKNPQKIISELNSHVTLYREMLIQMGQARDNPELRKDIRKCRQSSMETCQQAVEVLTVEANSVKTTPTNYVIPLLCLMQLFSKELVKSHRLIQIIPLDMSKHNDRNRPTNFGNIIGQILLCKDITPDFNQEEICSVENDVGCLEKLMAELKTYLPQGDSVEERNNTTALENGSRVAAYRDGSKLWENTGLLCCVSRNN